MLLIGDPSRHALLRALTREDTCVTDLAREVGLSQSCTTRHLQALERARVARGVRDGKRVVYSLRHGDRLVDELLSLALVSGAGWTSAQDVPATEPASEPDRVTENVQEPPIRQPLRSEIEDYLL